MPAFPSLLVLNTVRLTAATCGVSLPVGGLLAWLLARTDLPGRRAGTMLLGLMLLVPLYLQAAAWQAGFGQEGWYTLAHDGAQLLNGWTAVIWIHSVAAIPWVVLIVGVGFRLVEPELEEQAMLDASPWQVFLHVTFPAVLPALAIAALWVAIITAGEMTVTDLFAVRTFAEVVYTQIAVEQGLDVMSGGLLGGILSITLLLAGATFVCMMLARQGRPITLRRCRRIPLGRWRLPMALAVAAIVLVLIAVPLGSLLYKAGVLVTQTETGRLRAWSAAKCLTTVAAAPLRFAREFGWSLLIGSLAALGAVMAAIPLAWFARRGRFRWLPAVLIAAVCLAVPGPVLGLGVIRLLNRPELPWLFYLYDQSIFAPWLVLMLRGLPAAILILWYALRTIPAAIYESAAMDGAGSVAQWLWIVLPQRWPAVVLAWLIAMAVALADLATSILVVPPGVTTLSIEVFNLLHYGVDDQAAGICLALIAIFAIVAVAAAWMAARWRGASYNS